MAVKQTNTESNGAPAVNGTASTTASSGAGTGTKVKKNKSNSDVGGSGNISAEQPCCSGTGPLITPKITAGIFDGSSSALSNEPVDIASILVITDRIMLELNKPEVVFKQLDKIDMIKVIRQIIIKLGRVQIPRKSPAELKNFKEDIAKVTAFFKEVSDRRWYLFYLKIVCQLITADTEPPSCAVAIIFQLFDSDMICDAVQSLLDQKIPDDNIRKTVRLLSEWLRICNFCQNLNLWIRAILSGLQEQQKQQLFIEIASENIDQLFASLIIPVLRPKVAPIVFQMLVTIYDTPDVFHKILPKFTKVVHCLKQQSNTQEDYASDTKILLQHLVDVTSALMIRFFGCDALYEPIELALRDFQPSFNYLKYANMSQNQQDQDNWIFNSDELLEYKIDAKVGLVNLGNTCYMNSVLQALAMTKEFTRQILLAESKSPLLIKMQQQIALMLYSVRREVTPSRVLSATRPPGFSAGVQQDSSEFLGYLLETLHEQEVLFRKKPAFSTGIEQTANAIKQTDESSTSCGEGASAIFDEAAVSSNEHNSIGLSTETNFDRLRSTNAHTHLNSVVPSSPQISVVALSTIEMTFTGKIATTYKCLTCGWKSRNVDSFRDMQLSFPEVKNDCAPNYSVQDLIDYYCSPEKLYGENQYFCETCKKLSDAERYINVISAPKNLILTLKHFKYDQKYHMRAKLMHKVFHDEKVSVKVCSAETLEEIASVHYDIYAGIVHSGFSMDSGHYYTYAADATNKWYKFNDSIVTSSKSEELHNLSPPNTPYILFYQMGARSNEAPEAVGSTKVIKVDVPIPLQLDDLPRKLRDYVNQDNYTFTRERKMRSAKRNASQMVLKIKGNGRGGNDDNDDDDMPPPAGGCGGNTMNMNMNRYVY